eukprot:COSAG01_NODE_1452_length_10260_cov_26.827970_17_plen_51_part_00
MQETPDNRMSWPLRKLSRASCSALSVYFLCLLKATACRAPAVHPAENRPS